MSSVIGAIVTLLVGIAALVSTLSGTYTNYVKPGLRWPLILAGLLLVGLGASTLIYRLRKRGTGHGQVESIGILLLVFVAALFMAPPPLGADAVGNRTPNRIGAEQALPPLEARLVLGDAHGQSVAQSTTATTLTPTTIATTTDDDQPQIDSAPRNTFSLAAKEQLIESSGAPTSSKQAQEGESESAQARADQANAASDEIGPEYEDIPTTGEGSEDVVYAISLYDLIGYSYFEPEAIVGGHFEITGFAAPETILADGFRLTRYMMSCCAVDSFPLQVALIGAPFIPANDQWVVVEVVWTGEMVAADDYGDGVPVMEVLRLELIDPPADPYEY